VKHIALSLLVIVVARPSLLRGQDSDRYDGPIIDMHLHASDVDSGPDGKPLQRPCFPEPCRAVPAKATSEDDVLRMTLDAMDRHNIVLGFLSGDLDRVRHWVATAPGRFVAAPMIWEPGEPTVEFLRAEYKAERLQGMGEIATQYNGYRPNDPALVPYFALAQELNIPVHIHTLGIGARLPGFRSAAGNPLFLEEVLVGHPRLRLFVENAGFPFTSEMIAVMYQYPQLYGDLSTTTWIVAHDGFLDHLRALVRAGLSKRLMYGSDQMQWPETIDLAVEAIQAVDFLTKEQRADIFYNNAARFLQLPQEVIDQHHETSRND